MAKSKIINLIGFIKAKYTSKYYNIGFAPFVNDIHQFAKVVDVKWLKNHNSNKWYADPFILDYDDSKITIFVEEMDYHVRRGTLTELVIDRNTMEIIESYEILNLTTHLSFPAIFRENEDILVYPENGKSGNSFIYKYNKSSHKLVDPQLLAKYPLTDAAFIDIDCRFLLATDIFNPNGNETTLYKKQNSLFEPLYKYTMKGNIARNAGTPFMVEDKLVRPAQDCNGRYGKGVLLQTIEQDKDGNVTFETVDSLYPFKGEYSQGLHTFNVYKDMVVIDSYKEPNKILNLIVTSAISVLLAIKNIVRI